MLGEEKVQIKNEQCFPFLMQRAFSSAVELQLDGKRIKKGNNLKMQVLMAAEPLWSQISANTAVRREMSCLH